MHVLVAVPWRGGCHHRAAALAWVSDRWGQHGHHPVLGQIADGPWVKAHAVAAATRGCGCDVLVVADADVWSDGIPDAIDAVREGAAWAVPHHLLHRLDEAATRQVLAGRHPKETTGRTERPYAGRAGGGVVVLRREVWEDCPLDPRFAGWGHEDEAWALALRCLYGPAVRFEHPMWHLWHPPQPRINRGVGSAESERLYRRYAKAQRNPSLMRALVEEVT